VIYVGLYLLVGFVIGCFHYFRSGRKDIPAVAELVGIMFVWALLGVLYVAHEALRIFESEDE
jgi:hypothetical protein